MKKNAVILISLFSLNLLADINVGDVKFNKKENSSQLVLEFTGEMAEVPNWNVVGKTFVMTVPAAKLKSPMTKKVGTQSFIKAIPVEDGKIKITMNFPQDLQKSKDKISLSIQDGALEVLLPKMEVVATTPATETKKAAVLDESYLNNLVKEVAPQEEKAEKKIIVKDEIKLSTSAMKKPVEEEKTKKSFSLTTVAFKLLGFLTIVLGVFYAIVTIFKKGVVTKGKLGFLNNTDLVQVLNTTHLGNKKSLILVKVHQQAFLISNTEKDLQFIAEVQNLPGLIKEGERQVAGDNFDTNYDLVQNVENIEERVVLKQDIHSSQTEDITNNSLVRFSDQLKNKMKGLRPL